MKVLISAYACEPGKGSEPGAGWEWSRAAAQDHDVWVLTRTNNAPAIMSALQKEPDLRLTPVYLDLPEWGRFWKRGQRGVRLYYLLWQILAWRRAIELHRQIGFDVAHHLTFAVDWMPAGVAWIKDLPLVWGPVGGASGTPWKMWKWLGLRGLVSELAREVGTGFMRLAFGDKLARRASVVVAQNPDVARRFNQAGRLVVEPNVVVDAVARTSTDPGSGSGGVHRATFAARLIPWKGLQLAIEAIAAAPGWVLDVYGDGPDRRRGEELAERLGVGPRVRFHGAASRSEVIDALMSSDALLHPSMHDAAGWVVAEAVATGCPVLCLDRGGPPIIATSPRSVAVPADHRATEALAQALAVLARPGITRQNETRHREGMDRWSKARLPELLRSWYVAASCSSQKSVPGEASE